MKTNLPPTIADKFEAVFADAKLGFLKDQERRRAFFLGYHACFHQIMNLTSGKFSEAQVAATLADLDQELADYLKKLG